MIMYRQNDYWDINFSAINDEIYSHYVIMMFYQQIVFCPRYIKL